jgi:acyl-coenzyme A synthetase/AMP-(fatty) acid ligase
MDIHVDKILFARMGAIPRTASGKPRRTACRALVESGEM